jgi:hypothetical protein
MTIGTYILMSALLSLVSHLIGMASERARIKKRIRDAYLKEGESPAPRDGEIVKDPIGWAVHVAMNRSYVHRTERSRPVSGI